MASNLAPSLDRLSVSQGRTGTRKKEEPADSWDDEQLSSSDDNEGVATPTRPGTSDLPAPPPPTPASPSDPSIRLPREQAFQPINYGDAFDPSSYETHRKPSPQTEQRRPDKTTSVASRLIAAGIGQQAPKRTPEQREYDQAMKLQEKKKRDQAREEEARKKREKEQALKAIWDD